MSSQQQNRQPKGTPTGGQYAEMRRVGADIELLDDTAETLPETYAIDRAFEVADGPWQLARSPYLVPEAIIAYGPGGIGGRKATVFPWEGAWRYVVTEPVPPAMASRREVAWDNTETVEEAIHWAEGDLGWGETGIREGSRTPWGPAQDATELAPGITAVSTAGHGGIKLSKERNKEVHPALRRSSGWYEEDCEAHIVGMTFPTEMRSRTSKGYSVNKTAEDTYEHARNGVRNWFPDAFEKATGETVEPGQSYTRDAANWAKAHADNWIVSSASYTDNPDVLQVTARRNGESKVFHVPAAEYKARGDSNEPGRNGRFVVDPSRHKEIPQAPKPPKTPTKRYTELKLDGLTASQHARVYNDLNRHFRDEDGTVSSVRELIADGKVSGKTVSVENGKRVYSLTQKEYEEDSSYSVLPVSKATWDAFQGPDQRTALETARQDVEYHQHRVDQLGGSQWARVDPEVQRAFTKLEAARAKLEQVRTEQGPQG